MKSCLPCSMIRCREGRELRDFYRGTPQFVEDGRRGLFSYEALRSRLVAGRYGAAGLNNYTGPIIALDMLSHEEILVLLQKLKEIHALHYGYEARLSQEQLVHFMEEAVGRLGAEELLTPREVVRDFMDLLHTLHQHPEITFEQLVGEKTAKPAETEQNELDGFLAEFEL